MKIRLKSIFLFIGVIYINSYFLIKPKMGFNDEFSIFFFILKFSILIDYLYLYSTQFIEENEIVMFL